MRLPYRFCEILLNRVSMSKMNKSKSISNKNNIHAGVRLARVLWNYRINQNIKVGYKPYRIWVEPTNKCNLACAMCPNKTFKDEEVGFMDFDLYKKIVDEAKNFVYDMNIHHRGESTMHPKFPEMIEYAVKNGMKVKFHTNGTLLTEEKAKVFIEAGLSLISFSFDGYNKHSYEQIRINANFDKTTANIERFLKIKDKMKSKTPKTVMEVMEDLDGFEYEQHEKDTFLKRMKLIDRFIFKKPHNWGGNVSIDTFDEKDLLPCTMPWHAQVILWNGKVGPCPHDFFAKIILGDVNENSLTDVFNSPQTQELRRKHLDRDFKNYSPCNTCDTPRRNSFCGIPTPSLKYVKE